jgi:glycosyltransferase involved in cell wall biosynthesis
MAEEYVDAEHWNEDGFLYRLTKVMESRIFARSDAVVTLTKKIWPIVKDWEGLRSRNVLHEVVPCCADLESFTFGDHARQAKRAELGMSESQRVLVYSGSIGGWYLTDKMAQLFAHLASQDPGWHFLWLTTGPAELIKKAMSDLTLASRQYTVKRASPREVPSYLSASDAGIAFYKPTLSRLATSPVKVAEYLACGLPIVLNAGIGDSDALVTEEGVGVLVNDFTELEYSKAAIAIERLVADPAQTRPRTREVAERMFDVRTVGAPRYARLYEQVFANRN